MEHQFLKNSVGIWAFGPNVTRFVPPGYHPEVASEDTVEAIKALKRGVDLAAAIDANFIIWPGAEGYNYNYQRDYARTWDLFVEGVGEVVAHAALRASSSFWSIRTASR